MPEEEGAGTFIAAGGGDENLMNTSILFLGKSYRPIFALGLSTFLVANCGGTTVEDETAFSSSPKSVASGPPPAASVSSVTTGTKPSTTQLQDCRPGFDPNLERMRPCPWLASDGLCYAVREEACNCVCPTNADSLCLSSFYSGENGRTAVSCD